MIEILIISCSNPELWYSAYVGQRFPYITLDEPNDEYITITPSGYTNVVKYVDACIVHKGENTNEASL